MSDIMSMTTRIILCFALSLQINGILALPIDPQNESNEVVAVDAANAQEEASNPLPLVDAKDPRNSDDVIATAPPPEASNGQPSFLAEDTADQPFAAQGAGNVAQLPSYTALYSMTDVDLTPQAVAEYLLLSGDFVGFEDALTDLVRAKILSPEEVARYKRVVGWEYENLLREMLEAEAKYLQMFAKPLLENLLLGQYDDTLGTASANEAVKDSGSENNEDNVPSDSNTQSSLESDANSAENDDSDVESVGVDQANADIEALLNALRQGDLQGNKVAPKEEEPEKVNNVMDNEDELKQLAQTQ